MVGVNKDIKIRVIMRKDTIFWTKAVVGFLLNGRMDNFDLYGEWESLASVHHDEFIACIEADEEDVYVCVGSNEKGRKVKDLSEVIGASEGKLSQWMRNVASGI